MVTVCRKIACIGAPGPGEDLDVLIALRRGMERRAVCVLMVVDWACVIRGQIRADRFGRHVLSFSQGRRALGAKGRHADLGFRLKSGLSFF